MSFSMQLWLLGPWRAELEDDAQPSQSAPLTSLPTRHARALLARLALAHPDPVPRAQLHADLFPGAVHESAGRHLRTTLYYVHRTLGDLLLAAGDCVALVPDLAVVHDVGRFWEASAPDASLASLRRAIHDYRGSFLETPSDGWAAEQAWRLHDRYVAALRRLVILEREAGTPESALEAAGRWIAEEPWEEAAHCAYLEGMIGAGDRPAAEAHLVRARAVLKTEWGGTNGTKPTFARLDELARAITRLPSARAAAHRPAASDAAGHSLELDFGRLPMIGRAAELQALEEAWAAARQGQASAVLVEGPDGIGKTRLIDQFLAHARLRTDHILLCGTANEHTPSRTLGLLRDAFLELTPATRTHLSAACAELDDAMWSSVCHYVPELAGLLPGRPADPLTAISSDGSAEATRRNLTIAALLEAMAARAPLLFILENVHQADAETLALHRQLSGQQGRVLAVLTRTPAGSDAAGARPGGRQHTGGRADARGSDTASGHPRLRILHLNLLGANQVHELLRLAVVGPAAPGLLDRLAELSGGNPLFIREILRTLAAQGQLRYERHHGWYLERANMPLPGSVVHLLAERLSRLSPAGRNLASVLAVLGRPAEDDLLEQLLPDHEIRLAARAELTEAGVLSDRGMQLAFDHDWLRETLAAGLDPATRVGLHAAIAQVLCAQGGATPAELMAHYAGAQQWAPALAHALLAGERALAEGRPAVMERILETAGRAVAALDLAPDEPRRWALLALRESFLGLTEHGSRWAAALDELEVVAEASGQRLWKVEALTRRGCAQREQEQLPLARQTLRRAAELAVEAGLPRAKAIARSNLAFVLNVTGEIDAAWAESEAAVRAAEAASDANLYASNVSTAAFMQMYAGQVQAAEARLDALLAHPAVQAGHAYAQIACNLSVVKQAAGDYEGALTLAREAAHRAQAEGDVYETFRSQTVLTNELLGLGQFQAGRTVAEAVLPPARRMGPSGQLVVLLSYLARALHHAGETEEAWAMIHEAIRAVEGLGMPEYEAGAHAFRASFALDRGQPGEAHASILRAERVLAAVPQSQLPVAHIAARTWLALGCRDEAARAAHTAVERAATGGMLAWLTPEAVWEAGRVLSELEGPDMARSVEEQAYGRLLREVQCFKSAEYRRALLTCLPAHRALAAFCSRGFKRLVYLPLARVPLGRQPHEDELIPVVWSLSAQGEPPLTRPEGRRRCLRRLCDQAVAQGGVATVEALAQVLDVSQRTLLRDLQVASRQGAPIITRGSGVARAGRDGSQ